MKEGTSKILKWSLLVCLAAYAVVIALWARGEASRHVCTGVEIQVANAQSPAMDSTIRHGVMEELGSYPKPVTGQPMRMVNTADVENYLRKRGNFESVNCMMSSRGRLIVKVEPLVPVMRLFYGGGSYYINKEGRHIATNAEFFTDVPLVTGNFSRTFQPRDIIPLVKYVEKTPMLRDLTAMIVAQGKNDLLLVPRIRGHVVNFGDTTRLEEKSKALAMFYRQVMPYKGWEEYDTISVKFRGQVVATRRDKSRLNHSEEYEESEDLEEGTLPDGGMTSPGGASNDTTSRPAPVKKPEAT